MMDCESHSNRLGFHRDLMATRDYDRATLIYVRLARLSFASGQVLQRDRFLVLAGIAALHAGLMPIADRCQALIRKRNPKHLFSQYDCAADAARDPDFQQFFARVEAQCPLEVAENLLQRMGVLPDELGARPGISLVDLISSELARSETPTH